MEDDNEMDFSEAGWEGVDWVHLVQDRDQWWAVVNTGNELSGSIKCGGFLDYMSD
jgi:hypothetical protein